MIKSIDFEPVECLGRWQLLLSDITMVFASIMNAERLVEIIIFKLSLIIMDMSVTHMFVIHS